MKPFRRFAVLFAAVGSLALAAAVGDAPALAQNPQVVIGIPSDGVFGLVGKYILEKGIDRKHGIEMQPKWAPVPEIERLLVIGAIQAGLAVKE